MRRERRQGERPTRRRRSVSRRWCIPPAILREENETLEYALILQEHREDVGLLLWRAIRDVTLWAEIDPERREGLFRDNTAAARLKEINEISADVRVVLALTTLTAVVAKPADVSPDVIVLTCLDLSKWAEERATLATAVSFAQAAALVEPEDPRPAVRVGQLAARWGRSARAETWLRRATGLARRAKEWESYADALVGLGDLYIERGMPTAARHFYTQGMRAGRRHGLLPQRGVALHGMLRVSLAAEPPEYEDAMRYARAAVRALRKGHPALPDLMLDVAYLWVLTGQYDRAANHLRKLLVGMVDRARRARTLAVLARACAGMAAAGGPTARPAREGYEQAWSDAWMLITGPSAVRDNAVILLELVRAAAVLNDTPRLEQAARLDRDSAPHRKGKNAAGASQQLRELAHEAVDRLATAPRETLKRRTRPRSESPEPAGGDHDSDQNHGETSTAA